MDHMTESEALQEQHQVDEAEDHYRGDNPVKVTWACPVCGGYTKGIYSIHRVCVQDEDGCGWSGKMRKNRKGEVYYPN